MDLEEKLQVKGDKWIVYYYIVTL